MKYPITRCIRLFAAMLSLLYFSFAQAEAPKVCVVSFLESYHNKDIVESTRTKLTSMGYTNAEKRFDFSGYPASLQGPGDAYSSLKNCFEFRLFYFSK